MYGGAFPVLAFGLLASIGVFAFAERADSRDRRAEFELLARDRVLTMRAAVFAQLEDVHSLRALLESIEGLTREDFSQFCRDQLSHPTGTQALEWIPRVPRSLRSEYVERARQDGFPDFEFRERGPGSLVTAGERDEYYPVYYLEPFEGNERALGFDLASDPTRSDAIERCLSTRQPAATSPIDLVQEAGEQKGILVFYPVRDESGIKGLVAGVVRVGDLLVRAMSRLQERPIDVALYDVSEPGSFVYLAQARGYELLADAEADLPDSYSIRATVGVADRIWMIAMRPTAGSLQGRGLSKPIGLLMIGIVATISLAAFLADRARNERRVRVLERELAHLARVATTGELAAAIAHELNQPLCAIVLNAQSARRIADSDRTALGATLDRIVKDGERAGDTIRNLREFLRDGSSAQRSVNLASIVREAVGMFTATDALGHPIEVWIEPGLPHVKANEVQIQQVILNLLRNSAEAVDESGGQDRPISVTVELDGPGQVVTSVEDAGPGIGDLDEGQLFAPFFTTKERGMGMGLAICKSIVEAHGGRIWAGEARAGGARFSFALAAVAGGEQ